MTAPATIERAARRAAAEAKHAETNAGLANAVLRDSAGKPIDVMPDALPVIAMMAREGATQNLLASRLGLSSGQFKRLLGKSEDANPLRLSWERGRAEHEQDVVRQLLKLGQKSFVSMIYYSKAQLGWRENDPAQVDVDARHIQIVLPSPTSFGDSLKSLGQVEVADFRKDKSVPLKIIHPTDGGPAPNYDHHIPAPQPALPAPLATEPTPDEIEAAKTRATFEKQTHDSRNVWRAPGMQHDSLRAAEPVAAEPKKPEPSPRYSLNDHPIG